MTAAGYSALGFRIVTVVGYSALGVQNSYSSRVFSFGGSE